MASANLLKNSKWYKFSKIGIGSFIIKYISMPFFVDFEQQRRHLLLDYENQRRVQKAVRHIR